MNLILRGIENSAHLNPKLDSLSLDFSYEDMLIALRLFDLGRMSVLDPLNLDVFAQNLPKHIPTVKFGEKLVLEINEKDKDDSSIGNFELQFVEIKNAEKNQTHFTSSTDWAEYFECEDDHIVTAPNGSMYISATNNRCWIKTKKATRDFEFSFSALLSFNYRDPDGEIHCYFGKIDPFVKISSKG